MSADRVHAKLRWYGGAGMLAERAAGEVAFIGKTIERGGSRVVESG
jgi:hypothetical protein